MDRGSKFISFAIPVSAEEEVAVFLQKIKKEHPKARHFCTGLRLLSNGILERSSDDGEPAGSAGRPILGQIIKLQLTNVFIVVVRYFGGSKLGVPGLIEAYKTSAANALQAAQLVTRYVYVKVAVGLSYELFPHFLNFCKKEEIPVFEESFSEKAQLVIGFKKGNAHLALLEAMSQFSQLNLDTVEAIALHLGMKIHVTGEEVVI